MDGRKSFNTKKPVRKKSRIVSRGVLAKKKTAVLKASDLGVEKEHLLDAQTVKPYAVSQAIFAHNLEEPAEAITLRAPHIFHRPLVSHRASFWLGVGFGVLTVGALGFITWQLLKFEIVEAIVLGLN